MKLYVGNLPFSVTEEALKKAFSEYGNVEEASIITDKFSGRSKGFAFVTFSDEESGKKAISALNEKDFEGRNIKVTEAKPREESDRPPRRDFNRNSGGRNNGFNRNRDGNRGGNRNNNRSRY
jgi:RNA recognition motif-containing protein